MTNDHINALFAAGFKLCALIPGTKQPVGHAWNKRLLTAPIEGEGWYGFPLKANGRCAVDPDQWERAEKGMAALGFRLGQIMSAGVRTTSTRPGSGGRVMFADPGGLKWIKFVALFPDWDDGGKLKPEIILELRAESENLQDCVPGLTYYGKSGDGPYTQAYANGRTFLDSVPMPADLLAWWRRMSEDHDYMVAQQRLFAEACGGVPQPTHCDGKTLPFPSTFRQQFNEDHAVEDLLAEHGYEEAGGRWRAPGSTGAPGVRPIPGKDGLWQSDHGSDALSGTFDAWAAFVVLEHEGDLQRAELDWASRVFAVEGEVLPPLPERIDPRTTGVVSMSALFHGPAIEAPPQAIEGLVTGGLFLVAAPPKAGKSRLMTQLAVAWGSGQKMFGVLNAAKLRVLYFAAEDTLAEMQQRLKAIGIDPGDAVIIPGRMPANPAELELEIQRHGAQVVIIDTMAHFAPSDQGKGNAYDHDTKVYKPLKQLCDRLGVTILCVTHTGKPGRHSGDDPFMEIMGSVGKQGMANGMLVLRRLNRRDGKAKRVVLFVRARGMAETEYTLEEAPAGVYWNLVPEDDSGPLSSTAMEILEFLGAHGPNRPGNISAGTETPISTVYRNLKTLRDSGYVDHNGRGLYHKTDVVPMLQNENDPEA